jgi:hypothetical protein
MPIALPIMSSCLMLSHAGITSSTLHRLLGTAGLHRRRADHEAPPLPIDDGSRQPR